MTKHETKTESKPAKEAQTAGERAPRRRRRNAKFALPQTPALPVKALWEMASPEQRLKAHETSVVLMEYWLGRLTRPQMAERLKVPPLRIWQLSQQAISGMVAGLLIQPKTRPPRGAKNMGLEQPQDPENDPQSLRKRIAELERTVYVQERLISVLREMPGCRDAKIPIETPEEAASSEGMRANAAKPTTTQKAASPLPAGARHEVPQAGSGAGPQDSAKRARPGA